MALGPGRQPLCARSAKGIATALPSPIFSLTKTLSTNGTHARCLFGAKMLEAGRTRRYGCQVLAFKADSSLAKREASQADLACRPAVVRYRFVVPQYVTTYGQTLRVVGSLPELGEWNPQLAPIMEWSDGHQWSLECALPQRSFEFKITVFEGHGVKWEGGSNRVVQAEGEDGDVPVEIVVWLTCNFNATDSTQLQLAVPRASIEDAYETGRATLEFLKMRRSKLGQDTEQASSFEQRNRQTTELARLSEAVVEQSSVVHQLSDWLGDEAAPGRGAARVTQTANGVAKAMDDENQLLLLAIDSVQVPKLLRRISFVQSWNAGPAALALASSDSCTDSSMDGGALTHSPFLRGELDSRAEDLMCAAEILLQELRSSDAGLQASVEWASLAQEAGQVAGALEALGGGDTASSQATHLQLRGLASVGSALAGGSAPEEPATAFDAAVAGGETPVIQIFAAPSESEGGTDDEQAAELAAVNGLEQVSHPGAEDGAPAFGLPATASPIRNDGASSGVSGVALDGAGAAITGTVVGISTAAETAVLGAGLVSAGRTLPQEARGPEMHPLQRLAANVKDAVWVSGRPAAAQGAELDGPRRPRQQQLGLDSLVPSSAGGGTAQAAGSPHLQQQEPVAAVRKKWTLNIRAFLDSLFL